jgi:hypothetical protein
MVPGIYKRGKKKIISTGWGRNKQNKRDAIKCH